MPPKNKGKKGKKGADDDEYWYVAAHRKFPIVLIRGKGKSRRIHPDQFASCRCSPSIHI